MQMPDMSHQADKQARKLKKVKIALMRNPKFAMWQGLMMLGKTIISDDVPTACTNGRDEKYGRKFIDALEEKELAYVVLHENMHKAFRHMFVWRKLYDIDPLLANIACDHVINLLLNSMDPNGVDIRMPANGYADPRFTGMNAKQVFDILRQEPPPKGGKGGKGVGGGFDEHDWDGAQEMSAEEAKKLAADVDRAVREGLLAVARLADNGSGDAERLVGKLLQPKVDYKALLQEFIRSVCNSRDTSSWRRLNRRYLGQDLVLPAMIGHTVGKIVVGIDTSGSIGREELTRFITEICAAAEQVNPESIELLYWDCSVAAHEVYDRGNLDTLRTNTKPAGGGGTNPECVLRYLKEKAIKPECILMFTDGYVGSWGNDWPAPVLWLIHNNEATTAPNGKTIHIQE